VIYFDQFAMHTEDTTVDDRPLCVAVQITLNMQKLKEHLHHSVFTVRSTHQGNTDTGYVTREATYT